jgi:hypothetical protein
MNHIGEPRRMAGVNDWAKFLAPLVASVRNKPDSSEFTPFCAACADALAIPAAWLTPAKRRDAMAKFAFWPAVADVSDLFADDRRHAMAMRDLTTPALPPPEPRGPLSMAELLEIQAKVQAHNAAVAGNITRDAPKAKPAYMTPAQVLAQCEILAAKGNTIAAHRAKMLRAQGVTA